MFFDNSIITGDQIALGCYGGSCQCSLHIFRKPADKHLYERVQLFFRYLEDCIDAFKHRFQDDLKGLSKGDIGQFIREIEEDFSERPDILILSLFQSNHHVADKHDCYMRSQCIIRKAVALAYKLQIGLAGFEEHLNLPPLPIDTDDLFLCKGRIGADQSDPVLLVFLIPNADNPGGYLPLTFTDHDIYGKQVFTAAAALFADAEDLVDGELFPFVFITDPGTLPDHRDRIETQLFYSNHV